jgi:hypothetical protein
LTYCCFRACLLLEKAENKEGETLQVTMWCRMARPIIAIFRYDDNFSSQIGCSKATFVYVDERGSPAKSCVTQYTGYLRNLKGWIMWRDQRLRVGTWNFGIRRHQQLMRLCPWNFVILMDQNISFRMQNRHPNTWVATNFNMQDPDHSEFSTMISVRKGNYQHTYFARTHERSTYNCGLDWVTLNFTLCQILPRRKCNTWDSQ